MFLRRFVKVDFFFAQSFTRKISVGEVLENLTDKFQRELSKLEKNVDQSSNVDRIEYLRRTVKRLSERNDLIKDLNETEKLCRGSTKTKSIDFLASKTFHRDRLLFESI